MHRPTELPWRKPRHELLLLVLVAFAALSPVYVVSTQDVSRLCLTRALVHGRLTIEPCAGKTIDKASYGNHTYTDKAPGLSVLAIPAAEAVRLPPPRSWTFEGDPRLWGVRVLTSGLAFLLLAFAFGRVSEGIAPGYGSAGARHVRPRDIGGAARGLRVRPRRRRRVRVWLVPARVVAAIRSCRSRRRTGGDDELHNWPDRNRPCGLHSSRRRAPAAPATSSASVPPLALLGAYDWAAFGSPFHLSYRYVANRFASDQVSGFFGIHVPPLHGIHLVLTGDRGLLVACPVVVAAAAGLVVLGRQHRAEAIASGTVFALLLVANCGYYTPYGGISPGPRFLVPALPFLALGLAPAFARWRVPTTILAGVSIVATTTLTLTWAGSANANYRDTVWGELVRFLKDGTGSRLYAELAKNALVWAGPNRLVAAAAVCSCAAAAFLIAVAGPARR